MSAWRIASAASIVVRPTPPSPTPTTSRWPFRTASDNCHHNHDDHRGSRRAGSPGWPGWTWPAHPDRPSTEHCACYQMVNGQRVAAAQDLSVLIVEVGALEHP